MSYRPYEPEQEILLPASLQDWLPKGHLAYFIGDTVDALDLSAFFARYTGGGSRNQPFHPAMMVKVLSMATPRACSARARWSAGCTKTWQFGFSAAATFPSTARAATSARCTCWS